MSRRPEPDYYCPHCGARVHYMGFYQCTGCGVRVEIGELATAEVAARIRAERAEGVTCDALF
jgi:DNA-directed RNA polymerase subunit RPC12/RpoP